MSDIDRQLSRNLRRRAWRCRTRYWLLIVVLGSIALCLLPPDWGQGAALALYLAAVALFWRFYVARQCEPLSPKHRVSLLLSLILCVIARFPILLARYIEHTHPIVTEAKVELILGGYPGMNADENTAIQLIAAEVKRHPRAQEFVVHINESWLGWLEDDIMEDAKVVYNRQYHTLWSETQGQSPGGWLNVSDAALFKVARKHGCMDDVKQYGARWGGV